MMYYLSRPLLSILPNHNHMIIFINTNSIRERLTIVCEEEPQKVTIVKGYFKIVNGKRIYVRTHLRKR